MLTTNQELKTTKLAKRIIAALADASLIANDDGCNDSYRNEVAAETIVTVILNPLGSLRRCAAGYRYARDRDKGQYASSLDQQEIALLAAIDRLTDG